MKRLCLLDYCNALECCVEPYECTAEDNSVVAKVTVAVGNDTGKL